MKRILLAAGFVLALAAAAIGYILTRPDAPTVPADGGRYPTPQDIVAKLDGTGKPCRNYTPIRGARDAIARGDCYVGKSEVVVSVYASRADAQAHPKFLAGFGISVNVLVGRNWTLNAGDDPTYLPVARRMLGGKIVRIACTTSC